MGASLLQRLSEIQIKEAKHLATGIDIGSGEEHAQNGAIDQYTCEYELPDQGMRESVHGYVIGQ